MAKINPDDVIIDEAAEKFKSAFGKIAVIFVGVILFFVLLFDSFYTIKETETAVITTFGRATTNQNKGLQFKIPFIQKVTKVDTTVRGFTIGYEENKDGTTTDVESESVMITSDYNFVDVDFYISYEVKDPIKFLYASDEPEKILKNIAMSSIRSTMSAYSVDAALTTGKAEIQSNIKQMIIKKLEEEDIGISLADASMQDVEPPTEEVQNAFKAVETAKQNKESSINDANKYRNEQIPAAEAEADKILQEAEGEKTSRINEAKGQVARFEEEYAEYEKYPLITKQRMFYETMEELLPNMKVIIDDGSGSVQKYYPVESFANITTEGSKSDKE
ncbi:MAG: FtsH protease activity modulator HflK [Lachnospiraceae bacterium]|nr:FtsH protease activity modulator HflK [Lachnospiraceae bacterium]